MDFENKLIAPFQIRSSKSFLGWLFTPVPMFFCHHETYKCKIIQTIIAFLNQEWTAVNMTSSRTSCTQLVFNMLILNRHICERLHSKRVLTHVVQAGRECWTSSVEVCGVLFKSLKWRAAWCPGGNRVSPASRPTETPTSRINDSQPCRQPAARGCFFALSGTLAPGLPVPVMAGVVSPVELCPYIKSSRLHLGFASGISHLITPHPNPRTPPCLFPSRWK